jgi:Tfp pilus assembly protein PilZ
VRVVLIDRDPALLARVSGELTVAGMQVETLDTTLGLTPELLALSAPDVLLLDANLPGLPSDVIPAIFSDLRRRRRLRCMVVVEGSRDQVAKEAARLGADAGVPRQALLEAGARALKENSTPPAREAAPDPLSEVPTVRPTPVLPMQNPYRSAPPPPPPPPPTLATPPSSPDAAAGRSNLNGQARPSSAILSLIEDELAKTPASPELPTESRFQVSLDLFSEHTLFVGRSGTVESGGIFVATSLPPSVGSEVTLELTVFRKVREVVIGRVAWQTPPRMNGKQPGGCGVIVDTKLSEELKRALQRFLEERKPLTWIPRPPASG